MVFTPYNSNPAENSPFTPLCESKSGNGKAFFSSKKVYIKISVPRKDSLSEAKAALMRESVEIFAKMETEKVKKAYRKIASSIPILKSEEREEVEPFAY